MKTEKTSPNKWAVGLSAEKVKFLERLAVITSGQSLPTDEERPVQTGGYDKNRLRVATVRDLVTIAGYAGVHEGDDFRNGPFAQEASNALAVIGQLAHYAVKQDDPTMIFLLTRLGITNFESKEEEKTYLKKVDPMILRGKG